MSSFKLSFSRAIARLGLLGLGLTQVGCAHSVVEPYVSVHSRIGHFPVYTQIGVPGPAIYSPPPRVIYAPPPRVLYSPRVFVPVHGWEHGHERRWGHERRHPQPDPGGYGRGGGGHRDEGRR